LFWPDWKKWGFPDLVLELQKQGGEVVAAIAIEVKYEAVESGEDDPEEPELKDQLGRYAAGLEERYQGEGKLVVYLTADSYPPIAELERSWRAIAEKTKLDPLVAARRGS